MYDPEDVAAGIVACAESPKREVTYGRAGRMLEPMYALAPRLYCHIAPAMFDRGTFTERPAAPTPGNALAPRPDRNRVDGRWGAERRRALLGGRDGRRRRGVRRAAATAEEVSVLTSPGPLT